MVFSAYPIDLTPVLLPLSDRFDQCPGYGQFFYYQVKPNSEFWRGFQDDLSIPLFSTFFSLRRNKDALPFRNSAKPLPLFLYGY